MDKLELARLALAKNRINEALRLFLEIINTEPDNISAHLGAAECFLGLNEFQNAIDLCNKVLELKADVAMAHVIMAYGYSGLNEVDKSYGQAKTARDLEPDSADAVGCYGTLLLKEGKINEAIPILQKASALNPQNYLIHNNLAYAYDVQGDTSRYLEESKTLYRLKPNFKNARGVYGAYVKNYPWVVRIGVAVMILTATIFRIQALFVILGLAVLLNVFVSIQLLMQKKDAEFRRLATVTLIFGLAILTLYLISMSK
jgi:tetratricopeptide (TPR) repeat protein